VISDLLTVGDLLKESQLHGHAQHRASLLGGGNLGVAEVHHILRGNGTLSVVSDPLGKVLVHHTSLGRGSLAGLGDAVEHPLENLANLSVVKVGDSELKSGLAGDGGLGHGDLLSAGRSRGCGVRLFRSPSLTITIRSLP